jgi:acyl carrier protein
MPAETDIAVRIRTALADYLKRDVKTIKPSDALRDDLGLDSMATIELLYEIEDAFDVQIPDKDLQTLVTVADVTAYVEGKVGKVAPVQPVAAKPPSPRPKPKKKG